MEGGSSINVSKVILNAIPADVFIKYQNPSAADTPTEDQPPEKVTSWKKTCIPPQK